MRDPKERLHDILDALNHIERYTARGREAFEREELIQVLVVHHLQKLPCLPVITWQVAISPGWPGFARLDCKKIS